MAHLVCPQSFDESLPCDRGTPPLFFMQDDIRRDMAGETATY